MNGQQASEEIWFFAKQYARLIDLALKEVKLTPEQLTTVLEPIRALENARDAMKANSKP